MELKAGREHWLVDFSETIFVFFFPFFHFLQRFFNIALRVRAGKHFPLVFGTLVLNN